MISIAKTTGQIRQTLASRHATSAAWSVLDVAVYPLVMVFSIRFFMDRLGEQQYGIWMLVNSLIASLSLLNVGLGDATVKYVSHHRALGDRTAAAGVISASLSVYQVLAISAVVLCLGFSELVAYNDWHRAFHIADANKMVTIRAFQLGAVTFGLRLVEQIILSALKGFERFDAAARLSIVSKLTVLGLNLVMVGMGYQIVQIFLNSMLVTAAVLVAEALWLLRIVPQVSFWPRLRSPYMRELSGYGFWAWIGILMGVAGSQLDKVMVPALAGVVLYGYYSAAALFAERGLALLAAGASFLFPVISARTAQQGNLEKMFLKTQMVMVAIGLCAATAALLLREPVLGAILRDKYVRVAPFVPGFFAYVGVMSSTVIPYYFMQGSGLVRLSAGMRAISLGAQVAVVPATFYFFGPAAIPFGIVTAHHFAAYFHFGMMAQRIFKVAPVRFALAHSALPALFLVAVAVHQVWLTALIVPVMLYVWKRVYFDRVGYVFK